jgi:hypothetical protein
MKGHSLILSLAVAKEEKKAAGLEEARSAAPRSVPEQWAGSGARFAPVHRESAGTDRRSEAQGSAARKTDADVTGFGTWPAPKSIQVGKMPARSFSPEPKATTGPR